MRKVIAGGVLLALVGLVIVLAAIGIGTGERTVDITTSTGTTEEFASCGTPLAPRSDFPTSYPDTVPPSLIAEQCAPITYGRTTAIVMAIGTGAALMGCGTTTAGFGIAFWEVVRRNGKPRMA